MKAADIYNKAKNEVIAFASNQMENIKDYLVRTGLWDEADEKTWEFSPYWLDLSDFGKELSILVPVMDTYTMDFYDELRKVVGIQFDNHKSVAVVLEGQDLNEEDGIYLHTLDLYESVKVTDLLEEIWLDLVHGKETKLNQ